MLYYKTVTQGCYFFGRYCWLDVYIDKDVGRATESGRRDDESESQVAKVRSCQGAPRSEWSAMMTMDSEMCSSERTATGLLGQCWSAAMRWMIMMMTVANGRRLRLGLEG